VEIKGSKAAFNKQLFKGKIIINIKCVCYIVLLLISTSLLLTACEPAEDLQDHANKNPDLQEQTSIENWTLPEKDAGEMEAIYGWLSSDTILYSIRHKNDQLSQLMTWNLKSNERRVFYNPTAPISTVSISPSKSYILVSTTLEEKVQNNILNANGDPVYSVSLPAFDITHQWNVYNEGVLFLSIFFEDWTYNSYIVNAEKQTTTMIDHPEPFAQWDSAQGMLFLDWQKGESTLSAPLVRKELNEEKVDSIMLDIVHFKKMKNTLMTIQRNTENVNRVTYTFFDEKYEPISAFSVPYLKNNANLKISSYDFNEKKGDFFTFVPEKSMNVDQYDGNFALIKFNWKTNKKVEILNNIEDEPLSCSPNGSLCLYGYRLDKMIDVKNHKIVRIFTPV
jgi:hypothetical protein